MPTKLSKYCEGIMEAAWLAAVIVVPVFFNVYSSRIFEPDKLTLLRTLALVVLAAWLVKLIDQNGIVWNRVPRGSSWRETLTRTPLLLPVVLLVVAYLISTLLSVTPSTSLWGSYQRLQGTYTTFSYIIIFAAIAANMRQRAQVERLITTVIIASLPVSLYGVLQRYKIDPVPWGGDTANRIAANMGNSIFVAAYLIMAFPMTAVRVLDSFRALLREEGRLASNFSRATGYVFIAALQVIALYFTGSRGPWLGFMASLFLMLLVLSLVWNKRWLTLTTVAVALAAMSFLVVLNIEGGPLESLRTRPELNRLGQVFDDESRTGRVRSLIWEGAAKLVLPHEPLEFPDGTKDRFNFLRPLFGYGPESMYVAYNPFYPPELTQVEKRNASPDRSHNETWDSLVITGFFGLAVYLLLFSSVFYYGFKWLGLIVTSGQRNLFWGLLSVFGIVSTVGFVSWKQAGYFGVGLPFGIILGIFAYLVIVAIFGNYQVPRTESERLRALTLMGVLMLILAHFVEINFGIAIAATRTYFWAFSAVLLVVGYVLPLYGEYEQAERESEAVTEAEEAQVAAIPAPATVGAPAVAAPVKARRTSSGGKPTASEKVQARKKVRRPVSPAVMDVPFGLSSWTQAGLVAGLILSIVLVTLGYDYISNVQGGRSTMEILSMSFTKLRGSNAGTSYGVLALILTSWLVGGLILTSEDTERRENRTWLKTLGLTLGLSLGVALFFWLMHSANLARLATTTAANMDDILRQVRRYEGILTTFYVYLFLIIFGLGLFTLKNWPARSPMVGPLGWLTAPLALILVVVLAASTNLRIIQADIAFKLAEPFTRSGQWPVAIAVYDEANRLAPSEDYYYLFLGRAYLEHAKSLDSAEERDRWIAQAEADLKTAQGINPLNTDHTANLARLFSLWSTYSQDQQVRTERATTSSEYFGRATTLSPNNARLWDEWALLLMNVLQKPDEALPLLEHAAKIDPFYDWTYGLQGDYYSKKAQAITDEAQRKTMLEQAVTLYNEALSKAAATDNTQKYTYAVALGNAEGQLGRLDGAISAYTQAASFAPQSEKWRVEETLARMYKEKNDFATALAHAQEALKLAPEAQKERVQALIAEISTQQ